MSKIPNENEKKGKKATVKSMRLDDNLIERVLLLVNAQRLLGVNLKANENSIYTCAIEEFLEKPENVELVNKYKKSQEKAKQTKNVNKEFPLRVDKSQYDNLKQIADDEDRSVNYIICKAIDEYIKVRS